jgi:hypothetical protein
MFDLNGEATTARTEQISAIIAPHVAFEQETGI